MTLASTVLPLALYAVVFQTAVYLAIPSRARARMAPMVVGAAGAVVTLLAAMVFGFDRIGLGAVHFEVPLAWGLATAALAALAAQVMSGRGRLGDELADSRLGEMSAPAAFFQLFVRIPVFTALIEEAFFRGLLHAALVAVYPVETAMWLGAGLFGLWHIGPSLDRAQAESGTSLSGAVHTVGTVVAMTAAGLFLVWLRIDTGSIWAPFAVHAALNVTMAAFARMEWRRTVAG